MIDRLNPVTTEVDYDDEVTEFLAAVAAYKATHRRNFPSNSELFAILRGLGYHRGSPGGAPAHYFTPMRVYA